jgi:hypothetical protein
VGGDEHRHADLLEGAEDGEDLACRIGVEVGRRLVGENDGRPVDHGTGDRQALLLAAGQRDRVAFSRSSRPTLASAALRPTQRILAAVPTIASGSSTLSSTVRSNSSF